MASYSRASSKQERRRVTQTTEPLILDLVEWLAKAPRPYAVVMDAWRTSCPRLTVWEDAVDNGYVVCGRDGGGPVMVSVTPRGQAFLERCGRIHARQAEPSLGGDSPG